MVREFGEDIRRCSFGQLKQYLHVQLFATLWIIDRQAPLSMGFSRQEYWSGLPSLLQGIFLTQGSNPNLLGSLHWQVVSLPLVHLWSPVPTYIMGLSPEVLITSQNLKDKKVQTQPSSLVPEFLLDSLWHVLMLPDDPPMTKNSESTQCSCLFFPEPDSISPGLPLSLDSRATWNIFAPHSIWKPSRLLYTASYQVLSLPYFSLLPETHTLTLPLILSEPFPVACTSSGHLPLNKSSLSTSFLKYGTQEWM